jgi:peroxiredoxin
MRPLADISMRPLKRSILLVITLLAAKGLLAQGGLKLTFETKPEGSLIQLSRFEGEMAVPIDSLRYISKADHVFKLKRDYPDGLFKLDIGTLESYKFVIAKGEMVDASLYESGSGMAFRTIGSKENDALSILMNLSQNYSQRMDSLSRVMNGLSDFHPRNSTISDSLRNAYHVVAGAYNASLDLIPNLFPETYVAQVLVPLDKVPLRTMRPEWEAAFDNDPAFSHVHFFHFVPWGDRRIITNPYLSGKVLEFLYNFTERSQEGIEYAIDLIMEREGLDPHVQAFLVELLVDFFTEKGVAEFVTYMQDRYLGNCDLPLSDEALAKIKAAIPIAKGEKMPDISLPDGDGMMVPLTMLQGEINVLMVWSSTCSHCLRELPRLKALYDHLGSRKMNVYAISLDPEKDAWLTTVREQGLNWINVRDPEGWESGLLRQLGIAGTPALFLLDAELKLLGRAHSFEGLQAIVEELNRP